MKTIIIILFLLSICDFKLVFDYDGDKKILRIGYIANIICFVLFCMNF